MRPAKDLPPAIVVPERRLEPSRYSKTQQTVKIQEPRVLNTSSHVNIIKKSNLIPPTRPIKRASKSTAIIKVHQDFFDLLDQNEQPQTQTVFNTTVHNPFKAKANHNNQELFTQTSQSNIDTFNMQLVSKGGNHAQNENRLPAMTAASKKAARSTAHLKPMGKKALNQLRLIQQFVQGANFV
jgi:hypothetical protein